MQLNHRRSAFGLAAVFLSVAGSAIAAAPAQASDLSPQAVVICEPNTTDLKITSKSSTRTITHAQYFSIPAGGSGSQTKSVSKVATIKASVSYSSTTTVSANAVMGEFSEAVGVELALSGEATKSSTESVTVTVSAGKYAFFHGEKKFNGGWTGNKCNSNGTVITPVKGTAISFAVPAEGAASCSTTYASSTFEYKAKAIAC
ncbi:hypothetical protein GCM10010435_09440 [Winogradskya consettensis]|uniref:Uncharacterized protein n=1 Tax=Winogradskya consettensis TaxID=113560 RepID=A0A919SZ55_9ACTN|nr:hypothetical protein [Actinoplanes consettensis]GIM80699.1 hypothetical protein Aco04nite_72160 [Actinoplanes consettensis]